MARALVILALGALSASACTRNGKEIPAAIGVAQALADETRYAREGRPRGSLGLGAAPDCSVFGDFLEQCPVVPTCKEALVAHEPLVLNVCSNERGALARILPCGSARDEHEGTCTSPSFRLCESLAGARCSVDLAVCDRGGFDLAVARCCVDKAQCELGTYVLLPRRARPSDPP